jgi:hypothetical protein
MGCLNALVRLALDSLKRLVTFLPELFTNACDRFGDRALSFGFVAIRQRACGLLGF